MKLLSTSGEGMGLPCWLLRHSCSLLDNPGGGALAAASAPAPAGAGEAAGVRRAARWGGLARRDGGRTRRADEAWPSARPYLDPQPTVPGPGPPLVPRRGPRSSTVTLCPPTLNVQAASAHPSWALSSSVPSYPSCSDSRSA